MLSFMIIADMVREYLNNEIGFFDQENGWNLVVNDLLAIHLIQIRDFQICQKFF